MQRHKLRTGAMIFAATVLAAGLVPATASASPSVAAQPDDQVVVVDCFMKAQVRPSEFLIACGDGNSGLTELEWSSWGPRSAVASGTNVVNDCKPYCAAGTFRSYPVNVRLERPEAWEKDPGRQRYGQLHLSFPGSRPEHLPPEVTYKLWD
ncbi:hypothetical protein AB0K47_07160 [Streptomyces tirandamycinicus]|uniref:hypothetical protein n=1 Tax=Streptomyces TaxID=1883 RepID=UPI001F109641|nr:MULTISPECIES: hypothetical protein [Streptomyces]MCY0983552.1 hypothetical protein [Streptomyces tirandamycinicus]